VEGFLPLNSTGLTLLFSGEVASNSITEGQGAAGGVSVTPMMTVTATAHPARCHTTEPSLSLTGTQADVCFPQLQEGRRLAQGHSHRAELIGGCTPT
jgi:hypothetical protein